MKVNFAAHPSSGDAIFVCISGSQSVESLYKEVPELQKVFREHGESLPKIAAERGFSPEFEKVLPVILHGSSDGMVVFLIGLGDKHYTNAMHANRIGTLIFEQMLKYKIKQSSIFLHLEGIIGDTESIHYISSLACGLGTANFSIAEKYKYVAPDAPAPFKSDGATLVTPLYNKINSENLNILIDSIKFTKEICVIPSNDKAPEVLSNKIEKELTKYGVKVEIMDEAELKRLGMHALLGVGQGSMHDSRLVVMRWAGGSPNDKELVFVGKGVTFDTGGISIKPSKNMEDMKFDMSGAGAVAGAMRTIAARRSPINVVGIVGFAENMPSGSAIRPGDILQTMSGKTIEVLNTDAEGRLLLADLLWYAQTKCNPLHIVDLATLTGAITVALGNGIYGGLYANDDKLADALLNASRSSGEFMWRMPMNVEYDKTITSDIADVRNTSTAGGAGSITAAHFLMRFVKEETSWAHLDIAGMAYRSNWLPSAHGKSVGFGVSLIDNFVKSFE